MSPDDGKRTEGGFDLNSIMHASEPLTTKEFSALDVDEQVKLELIGGARAMSPSSGFWHSRTVADIDVPIDLDAIARYAFGE